MGQPCPEDRWPGSFWNAGSEHSHLPDLLPGITNQTARVRYNAFYPWFLRQFEQRHPDASKGYLQDMLRRAECLFALAGARHAACLEEHDDWHGAGMVGREKLVPALANLDGDGALRLSSYATLEDAATRYFQNGLGGLGQYYFGPLRDIGVLGGDTRSRDLRYTKERGLPLAQAFERGVDGDRFFELLDADLVSLADLDVLATFCPCGLSQSRREQEALVDLLFNRRGTLGPEAAPRDGFLSPMQVASTTSARERPSPVSTKRRRWRARPPASRAARCTSRRLPKSQGGSRLCSERSCAITRRSTSM